MRPLVLLDVDGVLNAVGRARGHESQSWPAWRTGTAVADGRSWPIRWSPEVVGAVRRWTGSADVQWLTTWGHDANTSLRQLLELPHLPVAGTYDEAVIDKCDTDEGSSTPSIVAHAAMTPAAPDSLTGHWWKFDIARQLVERDPRRRVVWLDDDLAVQEDVRSWMRAHAECLLVAPQPRAGLTPQHVRAVDAFLASHLPPAA